MSQSENTSKLAPLVQPPTKRYHGFEAGYKIAGDPELRERKAQALSFPSEALDRLELPALIVASREALKTHLLNKLRLINVSLPSFPIWKKGSDVDYHFFDENDFEILDIAYHAQVEHYLMRLASVHDFVSGGLADSDKYAPKSKNSVITPTSKKASQQTETGDSISAAKRNAHNHQFAGNESNHGRVPYMSSSGLPRSSHKVADLWSSEEENYASAEENRSAGNAEKKGRKASDKNKSHATSNGSSSNPLSFKFDMKLKFETVPTWNGDTNTILGSVIPHRLQGNAKTWYCSLPRKHRDYLEKDWKLLLKAIAEYYMNHKWAEVMRKKANCARYRETGHTVTI
ncbi:hypothetical protein K435DRAFT_864842 [Dendrothele bispora CBS 962.96]|uniref:Uncharacterized protein n=1 Tax=Dendrothele bispora (strain CBS 962.96) TaxID=1314807 RepID=A0A4S8LL38_DENBC|nr:hypothetical protein K435DRAFT_864842 [Dendrothele bispora CBS 962.96]